MVKTSQPALLDSHISILEIYIWSDKFHFIREPAKPAFVTFRFITTRKLNFVEGVK